MIISRSLWKRTAIAAVAVAAIHMAFYATPRWWYSQPRIYPQAYEKAVAVLKEEFGAEAVEKGAISMPMQPVVVPYKGRLFAHAPEVSSYVDLHGNRAYAVTHGAMGSTTGVQLTQREARDLWAMLIYLDGTTALPSSPLFSPGRKLCASGCIAEDDSWPYHAKVREIGQGSQAEQASAVNALKAAARARGVASIWRYVIHRASAQSGETIEALEAVLHASFPPGSQADRYALDFLARRYAYVAGARSLKFLRKVEALRREPSHVLRQIPRIGPWYFERWEARQGVLPRTFEGEIWAVEVLRSKSDAEAVAILREAAFLPAELQHITSAE